MIGAALPIATAIVFAGAGAASTATIAAMIVPQWRRIARLAAGHIEPAPTPVPQAGQ